MFYLLFSLANEEHIKFRIHKIDITQVVLIKKINRERNSHRFAKSNVVVYDRSERVQKKENNNTIKLFLGVNIYLSFRKHMSRIKQNTKNINENRNENNSFIYIFTFHLTIRRPLSDV